jgi:ectoine hydroxylase-related dioxygenase (phytanoyl-CoA dioxygenase family)
MIYRYQVLLLHLRIMTASTALSQIREQGFTVFEELLGPDDIRSVKSALAPWLKGEYMGRNNFEGHSTERVYALLAKDPVFAQIVEHPDVLAVIDDLLEPDYLLSANLAINVHPGETPQPWHRDNDGGTNGRIDALHGISTIWAFDDFTEDNGATEIIPRSHLSAGSPDISKTQKVIMPAGSVLVFSGNLVHRGGANNSDKSRLAITPQYCQPWLRQLETMVLSVPPEKAANLSPGVQALLGYSIRTPGFMGYVDGMHPKRLIDSSYRGRKARGQPS